MRSARLFDWCVTAGPVHTVDRDWRGDRGGRTYRRPAVTVSSKAITRSAPATKRTSTRSATRRVDERDKQWYGERERRSVRFASSARSASVITARGLLRSTRLAS